MQKKGEGEQKHKYSGWQTKQETNDFEEWIIESSAGNQESDFLGSRGQPPRSKKHQEKALGMSNLVNASRAR